MFRVKILEPVSGRFSFVGKPRFTLGEIEPWLKRVTIEVGKQNTKRRMLGKPCHFVTVERI